MAADLPSFGWPSSAEMARALATYIDCPARIQAAVKLEFKRSPALRTIEAMRADHLAQRERRSAEPPFKPHEGYYPADAARKAEAVSREYVRRLRRERALSEAAMRVPTLRWVA